MSCIFGFEPSKGSQAKFCQNGKAPTLRKVKVENNDNFTENVSLYSIHMIPHRTHLLVEGGGHAASYVDSIPHIRYSTSSGDRAHPSPLVTTSTRYPLPKPAAPNLP